MQGVSILDDRGSKVRLKLGGRLGRQASMWVLWKEGSQTVVSCRMGLSSGKGEREGALLLKRPFHVEISQRECWRPRSPAGGNVRAPLSPLMSQRVCGSQPTSEDALAGGWRGVHQDLWAGITQLREFGRSRFHP